MKFYDCNPAPSPRRARMFIQEKGLQIDTIEIDLAAGAQFEDEFIRLNPQSTVPVLELDDGTTLTENVAIACYLEEIYPEPPLLGRDAPEKAMVANWNARIEFEGFFAIAESFRNKAKSFKHRGVTGPRQHAQIPDLIERGRLRSIEFLEMLNEHLESNEYICAEYFSMADITAFVSVEFAGWIKLNIEEDKPHLKRWHEQMRVRPSALV